MVEARLASVFGSPSPEREIYRPPLIVSFFENRLKSSELLDLFGPRLLIVAFDAMDPLREGCFRSSSSPGVRSCLGSGICSDTLELELADAAGRLAGDKGPAGLGGIAEKVLKPLTEGLRVCVGRGEKVGWKRGCPARLGEG